MSWPGISHEVTPELDVLVTVKGGGYYWATWKLRSGDERSPALDEVQRSPRGTGKPSWRRWYVDARHRAGQYLAAHMLEIAEEIRAGAQR